MPYTKFRKKTKPVRWEKLPPVPPMFNSVCVNCGLMHIELPLTAHIAVGFGSAHLTRNNRIIWWEQDDYITCQEAEEIASSNPDHDWRINYFGPLSEKEYQRQGDGLWVLVRTGMGFA